MPRGFSIGPLFIHFYGILIIIGALAATWLSDRRASKFGQSKETAWDMLTWLLIGGVVGARIWHVLTPPPSMVEQGVTTGYYLTHPLDMLMIWKGGLGIPGAVIGGLLALWIYTRKYKLSFGAWVDIIAPGLALAQAIGRWGNFFNQEVYGKPSNLPWAITIDPEYRLPEYANQSTYHPLFLYESLLNLATMGVLIWLGNRFKDRLKPGDLFLCYLVLYPVIRFALEFLRLDAAQVAGINANQTVMGVIAVISTAALIYRLKFQKKAQKPEELA